MKFTFRGASMTQIDIEFGRISEVTRMLLLRGAHPMRYTLPRNWSVTTAGALLIAVTFLLGLLLSGIGIALVFLSKAAALVLALVLVVIVAIYGAMWFRDQMEILVEWWIRVRPQTPSLRRWKRALSPERSERGSANRRRFLV